jgi:hypothetical protein
MIPEDEESDEEDDEDEDFENEYHTEENAVGKRLKPYKALNMQQDSSSPVKQQQEELPPIDTSSHPRHNHHKNDLIPEIEQVLNEKRSNQGSE